MMTVFAQNELYIAIERFPYILFATFLSLYIWVCFFPTKKVHLMKVIQQTNKQFAIKETICYRTNKQKINLKKLVKKLYTSTSTMFYRRSRRSYEIERIYYKNTTNFEESLDIYRPIIVPPIVLSTTTFTTISTTRTTSNKNNNSDNININDNKNNVIIVLIVGSAWIGHTSFMYYISSWWNSSGPKLISYYLGYTCICIRHRAASPNFFPFIFFIPPIPPQQQQQQQQATSLSSSSTTRRSSSSSSILLYYSLLGLLVIIVLSWCIILVVVDFSTIICQQQNTNTNTNTNTQQEQRIDAACSTFTTLLSSAVTIISIIISKEKLYKIQQYYYQQFVIVSTWILPYIDSTSTDSTGRTIKTTTTLLQSIGYDSSLNNNHHIVAFVYISVIVFAICFLLVVKYWIEYYAIESATFDSMIDDVGIALYWIQRNKDTILLRTNEYQDKDQKQHQQQQQKRQYKYNNIDLSVPLNLVDSSSASSSLSSSTTTSSTSAATTATTSTTNGIINTMDSTTTTDSTTSTSTTSKKITIILGGYSSGAHVLATFLQQSNDKIKEKYNININTICHGCFYISGVFGTRPFTNDDITTTANSSSALWSNSEYMGTSTDNDSTTSTCSIANSTGNNIVIDDDIHHCNNKQKEPNNHQQQLYDEQSSISISSSSPTWFVNVIVYMLFGWKHCTIPSPIHNYIKTPYVSHFFIGCTNEVFGYTILNIFFVSNMFAQLLQSSRTATNKSSCTDDNNNNTTTNNVNNVSYTYIPINNTDHWFILSSSALRTTLLQNFPKFIQECCQNNN